MKNRTFRNEKLTYGLNRNLDKSEISELEDESEKITPHTSQGDKKLESLKKRLWYVRHNKKD